MSFPNEDVRPARGHPSVFDCGVANAADGGWRCYGCDATAAVDAPVVALKRNFEITHLQYIEPSNFEAHFDVEQNVSTFCRTNNDAFNEHTFNMNTQSNEYYNLPCETMTAM